MPGVGRFASADTLVPDLTTPQQYNRYTYTLNNPLRYSDPTGHFSEEAIQNYIWGKCGNSWACFDTTLANWQADAEWWTMLRAAQAGDVLIAGANGGFFYPFKGQGQKVLEGIYWSDPYGNRITERYYRYGDSSGYTLEDFFAFSKYADASWDGFIRWSEAGKPSFYARNDTVFYQQETPEWIRKSLSFGWNILSGSVGFFVPGDKVVKALSVLTVGAAIAPSVDSLWLKVNGMQYGDVEVLVGDHRLVFHGLNNSYGLHQATWTWARESRMALRLEYWSE